MARGIDKGGGYRCWFSEADSAKGQDVISVVLVGEIDTENSLRKGTQNSTINTHSVIGRQCIGLSRNDKWVLSTEMMGKDIAGIELSAVIFNALSLFPNA